MRYRIARNGQIFGPYTEAEIRQYLATGNIVAADLAQAEGSQEWVPVGTLFQSAPFAGGFAPVRPGGLYPDPPDLPWWMALLLGLVTGGIFFVIWDIVQATWVKRVQPASHALALYIAIAVVYVVRVPASWETINYNLFAGPPVGPHHGFLLFLVWLGLYIASRSVIRQDILVHFNGPEPIGLRMSSFLTYLLGGVYVQYHFNRVNEIKRARKAGIRE